jgi:CRISPR-associated protein Csb3
MNAITLRGCAPELLLSHMALYGLAAILETEGISGLAVAWSEGAVMRPYVSAPGLTPEYAASLVGSHARRAHAAESWLHESIKLGDKSRALMSPRLSSFGENKVTWEQVQRSRQSVIDQLTETQRWLDLRFIASLGEPCYWLRDQQGRIQQDSGASRLEMQPRNQGSEFVGNRLLNVAAAIAARDEAAILAGLLGDTVNDEAGKNAADSRTATGFAQLGPVDNAVAWCALWGISQLPLAMRTRSTAATSGHVGFRRSEWFYAPIWHAEWRPARIRSVLASQQVKTAAAEGLGFDGKHARDAARGGPRGSMYSAGEVAVAQRWLWEHGIVGLVRFPVRRFGSDNAPERRAMGGEALPVRAVT